MLFFFLFPMTHYAILFMPKRQMNVILPLFPAPSGILHIYLVKNGTAVALPGASISLLEHWSNAQAKIVFGLS